MVPKKWEQKTLTALVIEEDAGGPAVQGHPRLYIELKASLSYALPC